MNPPPPPVSNATASPNQTLIHRLVSILEPLDPAALFPRPQPLEVELGSGDGSFAVQFAQGHPDGIFWRWNGCSDGCGKSTAKDGAPGWTICGWCVSRLPISSSFCSRANRSALCTFIFPTPGPSGNTGKTG